MKNLDKRKDVLTWRIAGKRVFIRSTYYRALIYRNSLRLLYDEHLTDLHLKPIFDHC